jgi:hypothetical protein
MFQDWQAKLNLMNAAISAHNIDFDYSGSKKVNSFLEYEFNMGFTHMIRAGMYSNQGCNLWQAGEGSSKKGFEVYNYGAKNKLWPVDEGLQVQGAPPVCYSHLEGWQ